MSKVFEAIRITDRVYWVGAIDWSLRDFHGYSTNRGSTYNAFLIMGRGGEQPVLIDTVKEPFFDEMMERIASVVDPQRIRTVVSHHAELDHSGSLPKVISAIRPEKLLTSKAGVDALAKHFSLGVAVEPVKSGAAVQLDDITLTFFDTRMIHWPESMVSYLEGDKVLFSQDAFGMHLASQERWVDEVPEHIVHHEMAKYFANILMPYSVPIAKALSKLTPTIEQAAVIANDHGPLWRRDTNKLLELYKRWCQRKPANKVLITYATMWQSTAKMAHAIAQGAGSEGAHVELLDVNLAHRSDIALELLDTAAWAIGTPSLNGLMFPTLADVLTYIEGLKPKGLVGALFGSYGWSPSAHEQVRAKLEAMKIELPFDTLAVNYVPTDEVLHNCRQLGQNLARKANELKESAR